MSDDFPEIPEDRYRIFQHIGKGAFSRVFLAYTPEYQRRAVKRIRLTAKPHMLLKEVEFLRRLEGKSNIVQLKEILFSERNFQTTVVTNYLDSDDFKSIILEFTPKDIQSYMKSLLQALSHLENAAEPGGEIRGILHRDVKPGNFLFERSSGKGLLIDFGLAQSLREAREFPLLRLQRRSPYTFQKPYNRVFPVSQPVSREASSRSLPTQPHSGTHGYRAPEILVPVVNQTPKIDTWSAGVILLQILTGKTSIFRGNPNTDVYELLAVRSILGTDKFIQQMSSLQADFTFAPISMPQNVSFQELTEYYNPDLLAVLPHACFDLCEKLLNFDPKQRLSASESLLHPFLTAQNVPNFRFQDGIWSKNPLSLIEGQDENQALKRRSQSISEALGLCKSTSETLADEYSKMILSQMIPLPKDVRKQIERAVSVFGADQSQNVNGLIIQRQRPGDYQFPGSQSVQDLSGCAPVTLTRGRLSSGFGWQARFDVCQAVYEEKVEIAVQELKNDEEYRLLSVEQQEKKENKLRENMKVQIFQSQFELANVEKEEFERAVRTTSLRRRVDPWIQPLKALDKELRIVQRQVRKQAEEYRRTVIEKGVLILENDDTPNSQQQHQNQIKPIADSNKKFDIATENNQNKIVKKSELKQIFSQKYPKNYTVSQARQNRVCSYFLGNKTHDNNERAKQLISEAWNDAEKRQLEHTSTNAQITKIQELNKRAAHLAAFSHRIALSGPGQWNCQGYIYYCSVAMPSDIDQQQYYKDIAARVYQFQRSLLLFQEQIKENDKFIAEINLKLVSEQKDVQVLNSDLLSLQACLQQPGYNKAQVQSQIDEIQLLLTQKNNQINQFTAQVTQLTSDKETIQQQINLEAKDRKEYFETYQNNLPTNQITHPENDQFENESNLWSETLSISDEFSEVKPVIEVNPDKLAEPYFVNFEEIKKIFQIKNTETQQRKTRRENMRKFERVYAKFYDPSVSELQEIQKELYAERLKLREMNVQETERTHAELLPRDQRIGILAKTAAIQQTNQSIQKQPQTNQSAAFTNHFNQQNQELQISSKLETEKKQNAVFQLFSSPLGRFYIAFYRLIGGKADDLTNRGLLLSLCKKADIPVPKRLQELQFTLQKLSAQYSKSITGKSDLLLTAAATQSELDLRSDLSNSELSNLGLSKRPPNLEYLLQIDKKLSPITRKLSVQRSTSAITGLTKSATHRSLADPGRTQSRYPQTAKYIQTMLEQTMRRYITMDGVLENYEKEMENGILAIKSRIFESQVQKMRFQSNGQEKVELGRICDGIEELGANTVFEILRGKGFNRSVLEQEKKGFDNGVIGDFERRKLLLDDKFGGAKARRMVQMYRK